MMDISSLDTLAILPNLLKKLKVLLSKVDQSFKRIAQDHQKAISCKKGCNDCCYALFDLSLLEAIYLAIAFQQLPRKKRRLACHQINKAANLFDKTITVALAKNEYERLQIFSEARIPCPLLISGCCLLYNNRPLTCRLYGIPIATNYNTTRVCYRSRFKPGLIYPTVNLKIIHLELEELNKTTTLLIPNLEHGRRDIARTLKLSYTHKSMLNNLNKLFLENIKNI